MLQFSPSLGAEGYFSYLESFVTTSHLALKPYRAAARKRFTLRQAIRIIYFEFMARRYASRKNFEAAAHNLSRATELSLTNTFDLVPPEEWKRILPQLGGNRESMMIALTDFPHLTQLFQLTDQASPENNIERRAAETTEVQPRENGSGYRARPVYIIDRRTTELQPGGKNLQNDTRFARRARPTNNEIIQIAKGARFSDIAGLADRKHRPTLRFDGSTGVKDLVWSGNSYNPRRHLYTPEGKYIRGRHQYVVGDQIKREKGDFDPISRGFVDVEGQRNFEQRINDAELMRLYLEAVGSLDPDQFVLSGLAVPDWSGVHFPRSPSSHGMHVGKSAIHGLGRSIALGYWSNRRLQQEQQKLGEMERNGASPEIIDAQRESIRIHTKKGPGSLLDPDNLVVRRSSMRPPPKPNALVFCVLDVSTNLQGRYPHPEMEMDEYRIDIARSFVKLLKPYFKRAYDRVDMVHVLHSDSAVAVSEDNFFKIWTLGARVEKLMFTGLESISNSLRDYPPEFWNVFGVQISNGRTEKEDVDRCVSLLSEGDNALLRRCKLFASIELGNDRHDKVIDDEARRYIAEYKPVYKQPSALWTAYGDLLARHKNLARHKIEDYESIWPVFGKIFGRLSPQATSPAPPGARADRLTPG